MMSKSINSGVMVVAPGLDNESTPLNPGGNFVPIPTFWFVLLEIFVWICTATFAWIKVFVWKGKTDGEMVGYIDLAQAFAFIITFVVYLIRRHFHLRARNAGFYSFYLSSLPLRQFPFLWASFGNIVLLILTIFSQYLKRSTYCIPFLVVVTAEALGLVAVDGAYLMRVIRYNRARPTPDAVQIAGSGMSSLIEDSSVPPGHYGAQQQYLLQQLTTQKHRLAQRLLEMQTELSNISASRDEEVAALNDELQRLEEKYAALRAEHGRTTAFEDQLREHERQHAQLRAVVEAKDEDISKLRIELDTAYHEIHTMTQIIDRQRRSAPPRRPGHPTGELGGGANG
eukprot:gnl/Trimastix_PCT/4156.p1 GENE.gnl/Trimastix_PCT/4156~~gnl/Trimastix_PCT/4156.p1  ORF type:complete len:341 (-),score=99.15 gnl/Trimastix_PCT/4156:32-1054(-)